MHRGLRQGGPLARFLFIVAAEGLAGMVKNAVDMGRLQVFEVCPGISYPIL